MNELNIHASNNVKNTNFAFFRNVVAENVLKQLNSVKLIFKESPEDPDPTITKEKPDCSKEVRDLGFLLNHL